jgi:hypothetical protein
MFSSPVYPKRGDLSSSVSPMRAWPARGIHRRFTHGVRSSLGSIHGAFRAFLCKNRRDGGSHDHQCPQPAAVSSFTENRLEIPCFQAGNEWLIGVSGSGCLWQNS